MRIRFRFKYKYTWSSQSHCGKKAKGAQLEAADGGYKSFQAKQESENKFRMGVGLGTAPLQFISIDCRF